MKIALVCKKFSLNLGGMEKYTVLLSQKLVAAGHQVHIFSDFWQDLPGLVYHRVPMLHLSSPLKNLSFAFFCSKMLSQMRFTVIHSMERILHQDIFRVSDGINPVQLKQKYSNLLLRKFKAAGPRRLALSYLENRIFLKGGCRFVMTNSALVKKQIIEYYRVNEERIVVIYNGVDTSRFNSGKRDGLRKAAREQFGIEQDEIVLLFIGNNFRLKGLMSILKAITLLKSKRFKLVVVGGDRERRYQRWAARNRIDNRVYFMGLRKDMERYYAMSDIFVLPTLYDPFAKVCLEAMACGLPVITTQYNGASELIRQGEHGYILKTGEAEEVADKIIALESASERTRIGKNAAGKAGSFTLEKHITQVLGLYAMVVRARSKISSQN